MMGLGLLDYNSQSDQYTKFAAAAIQGLAAGGVRVSEIPNLAHEIALGVLSLKHCSMKEGKDLGQEIDPSR